MNFLNCHMCGKCVSTGFLPDPTDTPDMGIIIRAIIICPECMETKIKFVEDYKTRIRLAVPELEQ